MSFNEESKMPERTTGHIESAVKTEQSDARTSSVRSTDRYGLEKSGKGYLTRKYNIEISKAGNPYFVPIESLLKEFILDADAALAEARARLKGDTAMQEKADAWAEPMIPYFEALLEHVGSDREWLARQLAIWPLTDQVGYQLYKATSGEADLNDYGTYLIRTDAHVESVKDLDSHEQYQKRQFYTDLAYDELAIVDAVLSQVDPDSLEYNLPAIIRAGYQTAASLDTRNHLKGVSADAPATSDVASNDIKSQILASRRYASQVA